jgi:hypothetical protein
MSNNGTNLVLPSKDATVLESSLRFVVANSLSLVLAIVLASTALLKLSSTVLHPGATFGWVPAGLLDIVAWIELALAICWLFPSKKLIPVWWLTFFLCIGFAVMGVWNLAHGVISCGCFGDHQVGGVVEIGITSTLFLCVCGIRPQLKEYIAFQNQNQRAFDSDRLLNALLGVVAGLLVLWFCLFHTAIGRSFLPFKRTVLTITGSDVPTAYGKDHALVFRLGELKPGSQVDMTLRIHNRGENRGTVIGAYRSCPCISLNNHLGPIEAGQNQSIGIRFVAPLKTGTFSYAAALYTKNTTSYQLPFRIEGTVAMNPDS